MKKFILTIDEGTTSTRSILFDKNCNVVAMSQLELEQICKKPGWVEHDAEEIWKKTCQTIANILKEANAKASDIAAIGITNQRETTVIWDKDTKKPVYNALCWQSRQSQSICDKLMEDGYKDLIQQKTGLIVNSYFSGSKIKWILDNVVGVKELANSGKLKFGTIDSYLLFNLTNGLVHATDYTNASRTMIYNIYDLKWDEELLKLLDIPECLLPVVLDSNANFGYATGLCEIDDGFKDVPITSMIGDQQASLFGQCCFNLGDAKNTYGTGCFMLMNTKKPVKMPGYGLLSTISWGLDGKVEYCLEGSVFIGGAGVQWCRDKLRFFEHSEDCEHSLKCNNPSDGVYVVPAFVGLGTPYWDADARGAVLGLTRNTSKDNITAATVESIAYQTYDVLKSMEKASGTKISELGVDGGACVNCYLMQFQADLIQANIIRPICKETTALGATYIAGLKVGFFLNIDEVKKLHVVEQVFKPNLDEITRKKRIDGWNKAVEAVRLFK